MRIFANLYKCETKGKHRLTLLKKQLVGNGFKPFLTSFPLPLWEREGRGVSYKKVKDDKAIFHLLVLKQSLLFIKDIV